MRVAQAEAARDRIKIGVLIMGGPKRRAVYGELFDGLAHYWHQFMYPEMSADYFDKMKLRMGSDPLLRARVEYQAAQIMDVLEKHGLFRKED